nr:MAG: hypothetical protein KatS3mg041_0978 [Bacteroidota bacterium]
MSAFEGTQPTFTHVPPGGRPSLTIRRPEAQLPRPQRRRKRRRAAADDQQIVIDPIRTASGRCFAADLTHHLPRLQSVSVAGLRNGLPERFGIDSVAFPGHHGPAALPAGHLRALHTGHAHERLFDRARAMRTGHSFDAQFQNLFHDVAPVLVFSAASKPVSRMASISCITDTSVVSKRTRASGGSSVTSAACTPSRRRSA